MDKTDTAPGHLRPDGELADLFRSVADDTLDEQHGAIKSATNAALLEWLADAPEETLDYHLGRSDAFDTLDELRQRVADRQSAPFPGDIDA